MPIKSKPKSTLKKEILKKKAMKIEDSILQDGGKGSIDSNERDDISLNNEDEALGTHIEAEKKDIVDSDHHGKIEAGMNLTIAMGGVSSDQLNKMEIEVDDKGSNPHQNANLIEYPQDVKDIPPDHRLNAQMRGGDVDDGMLKKDETSDEKELSSTEKNESIDETEPRPKRSKRQKFNGKYTDRSESDFSDYHSNNETENNQSSPIEEPNEGRFSYKRKKEMKSRMDLSPEKKAKSKPDYTPKEKKNKPNTPQQLLAVAATKANKLTKKKSIRNDVPPTYIDFNLLEYASLRRYKTFYKLKIKPNSPKCIYVQSAREHYLGLRDHDKLKDSDIIVKFSSKVKGLQTNESHPPSGMSASPRKASK